MRGDPDALIARLRNCKGVESVKVNGSRSMRIPESVIPSSGGRDKGAVFAEDAGFTTTIPVKTVNPTNLGGKAAMHWRISASKNERAATILALSPYMDQRATLAAGCVVKVTRVSAGTLSARDALGPALKHVTDAIAQWLLGGAIGERDDDERIEWELGQLRCERGHWGVIVSIKPKATTCAKS